MRASSMIRSHRAGITLVELLIALFIFSIVAALAGSGIVQSLRMQQLNESHTSLQAKLRRITEVISQDIRSTVLGAVTMYPYPSGIDSDGLVSLSFSVADGGQGFQVISGTDYQSGRKHIYSSAGSATELAVIGRRLMVVNGNGQANVQMVNTANDQLNHIWRLNHSNCAISAVPFVEPVRAFVVESVGYQFVPGPASEPSTGVLWRRTNAATAEPVAFDLSGFTVEYVYRGTDGSSRFMEAPQTNGSNVPLRVFSDGGIDFTLVSLQVTVSGLDTVAGGRTVERSYVSQIAMPSTGSISLRSVVSCS